MVNWNDALKEYNALLDKLDQGAQNLVGMDKVELAPSAKELVFEQDRVKLFRYQPLVKKPWSVPVLIVYALVNRNSMLDLQESKSLIRNLLQEGLEIYIIDWGDPSRMDRYLTLSDHIDGYLDSCVDFIREHSDQPKINLFGVCQGGTFSAIYASLYPQKVNSFVATVTPIDFDHDESLLNVWVKQLDVDLLVDTMGNVSGDFMNFGYQMLKPFALNVQKYVDLIDIMPDKKKLQDFMRMEKWIFDSPDQPGETIREFLKSFYQQNQLATGKYVLNGRPVLLKNLTAPLLLVYAEKDHLVPPCSAKPLFDLVGSEKKQIVALPTGHIGLYVSSKTRATLPPLVADWLKSIDQNEKSNKTDSPS